MEHVTATDIVLIITAITTGVVAIISAWKANAANEQAKSNMDAIQETQRSVNGHTDRLVAAAASAARLEGHAEGFAAGLVVPAPGTVPLVVTIPAAQEAEADPQ